MVLPLTVFAAVLVYYNYETSRTTAYDRILQIARGLTTNIDSELRATIASLQVLALSEALARDDILAFRAQAEHFVAGHFPQSNVVVTDSSGQQLMNTAVPAGTPLPKYVRMDVLQRVFATGDPRVLDTTTFDGTVVLTGFARSPFSGWSVAVGIPKSNLTNQLWRSVAILAAFGILCLAAGIFIAVRLATQLARSQSDRELLINELNHRVKNTLATVQGLVASTLRSATSTAEAKTALEERIVALARVHDVLTEEHWEGARLEELVRSITAPYRSASGQRIEVLGPELRVNPRAALAIAMVVNELTTNAVKYGALSRPDGRIRIDWSIEEGPGPRLRLAWAEMNGPLIQPPTRRGFGSSLIEQSITRELGGTLVKNFDATGLVCTITVPLERLT